MNAGDGLGMCSPVVHDDDGHFKGKYYVLNF